MSLPPSSRPYPDDSAETTPLASALKPSAEASAISAETGLVLAGAERTLAVSLPSPARRSASMAGRLRHLTWELVQTAALAILIFLAVRATAQNFRVEGSSMEPGLHDGQYLLVNKAIYYKIDLQQLSKYLPFINPGKQPERFLFRSPHRGDVVVFRFPRDPSRDFIKRIVGLPGDQVSIRDGAVFVNGVGIAESYVSQQTTCNLECDLVVPPDHYFVMGDNRSNSSDSRSWGFLPEANLIGQAMFSYWPLAELGGVGNHKINLGIIKVPLPF